MIFSEFISACHALETESRSYAVVTLIKIDAHVPQEVGAKMLITSTGLHAGTIGGGKLEAKAIELAQKQLSESGANLYKIDLNQDLGMVCGGVATIFVESSQHKNWNVAVYGAGHVGQALVQLLRTFACQLYWVDSRQEWLDKQPEYPRLKKILSAKLGEVPTTLPEGTYHIIATPGHAFDLEVLKSVLGLKHTPYIGVIGSKVKARTIRASLINEGFSKDDCERFHCPMGLPIGNNTPAEIAVSIAAQILERRDQKTQ
jgi:xanthine dehydrogenase accessory factor